MDWIGHHNDIAHWAIGQDRSGPTRVAAIGWEFPDTDIYNTPEKYTIRSEYVGGIVGVVSSENRLGLKITGSDGWVFVTRGKIEASDDRWLAKSFRPGSVEVYASPGHMRNFLDGVKSRRECVAPADVAHRSITPGHLAYVSQTLGKPLEWNAQTQTIVGDAKADALLKAATYRGKWGA